MNLRFTTNIRDVGWWFAAIILVFVAVALLGWAPGYPVVIALSGLQVGYFTWRERSLVTIPAQVRIVYFIVTLFGFCQPARIPVYAFLFVGTFMVVFFDRCSIEFMLGWMPWNKNR